MTTNQMDYKSDLDKFLLSHNLTKPSEVLKLMADSLVKLKKRGWFEISINTFGSLLEDKCLGCAATVTAINLLGLSKKQLYRDRLIYQSERIERFGIKLLAFERLIDCIRYGDLGELFDVLEIDHNGEYNSRWRFLCTDSKAELEASWRPNLRAIRKTIKELEQKGL